MRNAFRLLAFDILAPLAAVAGLLAIGNVLVWPWWWISACTALVLLIVQGVVVNFWLFRRDAVTVGTDDDAPGLRLAIAFLCAAALCAAVVTGYTHWTKPDREFKENSRTVVRIASGVAEAVASFSPGAPGASMDRAAAMMLPERAEQFKQQYAKSSQEMIQRKVTAQATTLSAGVEAIGPTAASVAVILRVTQNAPGEQTSRAAPAVRVTLTKRGDDWLVEDVTPLNSR
ncbi:hypothetical protein [Mycobacterium bourgelatii]|uniref:Transmembrane protein n=1 Tax=Mycobacterium bourgelatii TaxID=1273442 RepID=A0A7I9YZF4_MYCBU|nr:hypothetical protein [Mycobacterium bourgelatii]MCV6976651.1 hypothetical protein [Mycobacterium bourgelatii]GFG94100.1 hypothetical protein MBOU_61420 [Mycobacterium bourgelatii]